MTEYSFYKGIIYRNAKTRQSIATDKVSVRMPIVLPMQK